MVAASAEPTTSAMAWLPGTRNPTQVENNALPKPMFKLPGKCPAPKNGTGRVSITAAPPRTACCNSASVSTRGDGSWLKGVAPRRFTPTS